MLPEKEYFILDGENATIATGYPHLAITESGRIWDYSRNKFLLPLVEQRSVYYAVMMGRYSVPLAENGVEKRTKMGLTRVKSLVAQNFIPNPSNYPDVEPINGRRDNHSANNLRWVLKDGTQDLPLGY
jgi:hypothetical protein